MILDAVCKVCCDVGEPIVTLNFNGTVPSLDSEDVFVFNAKPKCSSSRDHQGSKVVLVISIPRLGKPVVSSPIALHARGRPNKKRQKLRAETIPIPHPIQIKRSYAQAFSKQTSPSDMDMASSSAPVISPVSNTQTVSFAQSVYSQPEPQKSIITVPSVPYKYVADSVVSYSPSTTICFPSSIMHATCIFREFTLRHSFTLKGPVVFLAIICTTCVDRFLSLDTVPSEVIPFSNRLYG